MMQGPICLKLIFLFLCLSGVYSSNLNDVSKATSAASQLSDQMTKVFDLFVYHGEDDLLAVKLAAMSDYVDYFVIAEAENFTNLEYNLRFNMTTFIEYSNKIIYLPVRAQPHRKLHLSQQQRQQNDRFVEDCFKQMLIQLAHPLDVLIFSQIGEVVSSSALQQFTTSGVDYACTELTLFNHQGKQLAHDRGSDIGSEVYWREGARLTNFKKFKDSFKYSNYLLRTSITCDEKYLSNQHGDIVKKGGWKFLSQQDTTGSKAISQNIGDFYIRETDLSAFSQSKDLQAAIKRLGSQKINKYKVDEGDQAVGRFSYSQSEQDVSNLNFVLLFCIFLGGLLLPVVYRKIWGAKLQASNSYGNHLTQLKSKYFIGLVISIVIIMACIFLFPLQSHSQNAKSRRLVINTFIYNGEAHILALKFAVTNSFVDYYIIAEGFYSHSGMYRNLTFDNKMFQPYAHKILFLPIRNYPWKTVPPKNLQQYQATDNEAYVRNSVRIALKLLATPKDILIIDDADEIISRESFLTFNPYKQKWVGTQQHLFYFYFNRRSVFDYKQQLAIPNLWLAGSRITTLKVLNQDFRGSITQFRFGEDCHLITTSMMADHSFQYQSCPSQYLPSGGWHFSYVFDDANLLKKMRTTSPLPNVNYVIDDFKRFRQQRMARNSYNKDVGLDDGLLPQEMVRDIKQKGEASIYAPYLIGIDLKQRRGQLIRPVLSEEQKLRNHEAKNSQIDRIIQKLQSERKTIQFVAWGIYEIVFLIGLTAAILVLVISYLIDKKKPSQFKRIDEEDKQLQSSVQKQAE